MGFSKEQNSIISHRNGSLLVSAAAGSGKTTTLVAHVLEKLCDASHPGSLNRMIIVTYTRAAAAEMKERLSAALEERLMALKPEEETLSAHLRHQALILPQARICTVDSLCSWLVRNYFQKLDLAPDVRVAEEAELLLLKNEVLDRLLEEEYTEKRPDFYALLDAYGSEKGESALRPLILDLYDSAQNAPYPDEWLTDSIPAVPQDIEELEKSRAVRSLLEEVRGLIRKALDECALLMEELDTPGIDPRYLALLEEDRQKLEQLLPQDLTELKDSLKALRFTGKSSKSKFPADELTDFVHGKRGTASGSEGYLSLVGRCRARAFAARSMEEELRLLKLTEEPLSALVRITLQFSERFEQRCREKNMLSFMDLEHLTLQLLTEKKEDGSHVPGKMAKALQSQFDEIVVDEYQDINQVQESILSALSGESAGKPNMFMVGDVKQSIYRFRRAKPDIFTGKFDSFSDENGADHRKIVLKENYRSAASVLQSANEIFSKLMTRDLGGVVYDEDTAMVPKAPYPDPGPRTELLLAETDAGSAERLEAEFCLIAQRIRQMVDSGETWYDVKRRQEKPLRFRDIVILMRSVSDGDTAVRILKAFGIPAVSLSKQGFYETAEIRTLLSLLAVIDNPLQDIPLASVLLSPLGGFTEEELAQLKVFGQEEGRKADSLYALLKGSRSEKAEAFLCRLDRWRDGAEIWSLPELLALILRESGYELYVAAMPGGEIRLANIRLLMEQAAAFEESAYRSLYQFNRFIERKKRLQIEEGEARLLTENADVVRIGTIHSSKGLEYPVVILAGMAKSFNDRDEQSPLLCDDLLGIALKTRDSRQRMKADNLWSEDIRRRIRTEGRSEELRILYVAMTRAKQRLILTASVRSAEDMPEKWKSAGLHGKGPLPLHISGEARSYLDWLFMCREAGALNSVELIIRSQEEIPLLPDVSEEQAGASEETPLTAEQIRYLLERTNYSQERTPFKLAYSVSALKEAENEGLPPLPKAEPGEKAEGGTDPRVRGTVYHKFMEHLEPKGAADTENLKIQLQGLTEKSLFTEEEAAMIVLPEIAAFYRAPIGRRAARAAEAGKLFREKPFMIGIPQKELFEESESSETVLVQGIIDMYFEEEDGTVLIDYKTDRVRDEKELADRYRTQLEYYRRALEDAGGKPVKACYIYSFALRRFVEL